MNFKSPSSRQAFYLCNRILMNFVEHFNWFSNEASNTPPTPHTDLGKQHLGVVVCRSPLRRYLRFLIFIMILFFYFFFFSLFTPRCVSLGGMATTTDYRIPHTGKARRRSTGAGSDDTNGAVQVAASESAGTIEPGTDMESCGHCTQRDICLRTGMAKR